MHSVETMNRHCNKEWYQEIEVMQFLFDKEEQLSQLEDIKVKVSDELQYKGDETLTNELKATKDKSIDV